MSKIKAAAIQMKCSTNPKESLSHAEEMVREAAANGANVILLPELFEREYFCQQRRYDFYQYAKTVEENKAVQMGKRLAKELQVVLPISFYEKDIMRCYFVSIILESAVLCSEYFRLLSKYLSQKQVLPFGLDSTAA